MRKACNEITSLIIYKVSSWPECQNASVMKFVQLLLSMNDWPDSEDLKVLRFVWLNGHVCHMQDHFNRQPPDLIYFPCASEWH